MRAENGDSRIPSEVKFDTPSAIGSHRPQNREVVNAAVPISAARHPPRRSPNAESRNWDAHASDASANRKSKLKRRHRRAPAGVIPCGPLVGLPKKRPTDATRALAFRQVRELANAEAFAALRRMPLNAALTVRWNLAAGFEERHWPAMQTKLLDRLARFLRRHGIPPAFVWSRERQPGAGPHTHVMIHLGANPGKLQREALRYLAGTMRFGDEAGSTGLKLEYGAYGMNTPLMRTGQLKYLCKGLDHAAFIYAGRDTLNLGDALGINHRGMQGTVTIKRSGVSQSISRSARRKAGWIEVRDISGVARLLNPNREVHGA